MKMYKLIITNVLYLFLMLQLIEARFDTNYNLHRFQQNTFLSNRNPVDSDYLRFNRQHFRPLPNRLPQHWPLNNELNDAECKPSILPPNPSSQCCGVDVSSSNRIIGGAKTGLFQYPWMVMIEYKVKLTGKAVTSCGGSLISGRYVLTAGHCVAGNILVKKSPTGVILGEYDRSNPGVDCVKVGSRKQCAPAPIRIRIASITPHEEYVDSTFANDIALIRLSTMAPYTDTIRPICLPTRDFTLQNSKIWLTVAGWGVMNQTKIKNKKDEYNNYVSAVKRHIQLPFVPLKTCRRTLPFVSPKQLCAGGEVGKDSCFGDSGGPLMLDNDGVFEKVGIVSFGEGNKCGVKGLPAIYTHVFKYLDWIWMHIENSRFQ